MNWTIITPFGREKHAQALKDTIKAASEGMSGKLRWLIITDDRKHLALFDEQEVVLIIQKPGWFKPYTMLNCALDQLLPMPDHANEYIGELSDDDAYEPGFFAALEVAAESNRCGGVLPEVMAVSMKRWHLTPNLVDTLTPNMGRMHIGMIGLEQLFIRADVMALHRFNNTNCADGELAEKLSKERPGGFCLLPDLFVHWNKLT